MLETALWAALCLLVLLPILVLVVLCLPLRIEAEVEDADTLRFRLKAFILRVQIISVEDLSSSQGSDTPDKRASRKDGENKTSSKIWFAEGRSMISAAPSFLADLAKCFKFEELILHVRFGLSDPADTGAIYGMLAPFVLPMQSVRLSPVFDDETMSAKGRVCVFVTPIALVPPISRFAWAAIVKPRMSRALS